jgi:putative heme-binding domain-containing protein
LLDRQIDDDDPFIPWLLWWAIEEKSISSSDRVLAYFARSEAWKNNSIRVNIARLMRRYAAAGTSNGYGACERLLQNTPAAELETVLAALNEGLAERATALKGVGSGGLYESFAPVQKSSSSAVALNFEPLTPRLKELIADHWHADRVSPIRLRLAIRGEIKAAYDEVVSAVAGNNTSSDRRLALLEILDELGEDGCVPTVMKLINGEQPESVQLAALKVLGRFGSEPVTSVLLASYPKMSAALRSRSRDVLFNRPDSTRALLKLVDEGQIPAADMPLDELRRISLHRDAELDALVHKHWGNIQPGTPEEKLAVMRRMNNDLRAGTGDHSRGHVLFVKHCATCHRLFDEGGSVGPDLTPANRGDRDFLLASLVDPSAVIRSQYLSYVVATHDGAVLTGIIAEQDAAGITLLDAKNQRTRIERSKIGEIKESAVSIMPENLIEQLTPQDLRDLFSYVQSQKN